MRLRTVVALSAATALAISTMTMGSATAAGYDGATASAAGVSATASNATGGSATAGSNGTATSPDALKCGTGFGTGFDDGIISGGAGFATTGAADFTCPKKKKKRTFKTVTVHGYFGDAGSSPFTVTVYGNSSGEPDDSNVVCTASGTGTPTGAAYPVFDIVTISLTSKCVAAKGVNWIAVNNTGGGAWYWRTQSTVGGSFEGDWRDPADSFGTGCTTFANGRDMENCIFGGDAGQNDFMLELS